VLDRPVIDHWWQTETGWAMAASCRGLEPPPVKAGSPSLPVPGYRIDILDGAGDALAAGFLVGGADLALEAAARCVAQVGAMP